MKESKFIELLNLYVDHQITPADAAWLESEIQQKPERRQIYRQYCQMQKACVVLAENFRTSAPAAAVADGHVVEFVAPRRRGARVLALGAIAAAACAVLVVVNRRTLVLPAGPANHSGIARTMPAAAPMALAPLRAIERPALQPAFAGLVRETAATDGSLSDRANFAWMTRVQLDHVPADQLWFEAQPRLQAQELMFHARPASQTQAENAAFRFQR